MTSDKFKLNEVGVRSNRTRVNKSAWVGRQPACTSEENKLVPVCAPEASQALGVWKSANVLTDHIALEAGFSKQPYQAQCLTIDNGSGEEKFVHVKKCTLVSSSCGWPEFQKV